MSGSSSMMSICSGTGTCPRSRVEGAMSEFILLYTGHNPIANVLRFSDNFVR